MGRVGQTAMGERVGRQQVTELIVHHRLGRSNQREKVALQRKESNPTRNTESVRRWAIRLIILSAT